VILVVHLAQRFDVELCPNYVMAEHRLELDARSIYVAHELAQLVPLYGVDVYRRLVARNAWAAAFLPNASPREVDGPGRAAVARLGQSVAEAALAGRVGDAVERWESGRKIPRLRQIAVQHGGTGAVYTPDLCKGHADDHAAEVHRQYLDRLAALEML
jgi:hypothetical protein